MPLPTSQRLLQQLALHDLLEPLSRAQAEMDYVLAFPLTDGERMLSNDALLQSLVQELGLASADALAQWRQMHQLQDNEDLLTYARFRAKRRAVIEELLKSSGETLFLRYKDRLDRVLYSLLRVESEDLAYNLFYAIESRELEFGEAARQHSCGPEARTEGIVGPVDLTTPHPEVAARLRTAAPRQLFPPFPADQWYAVIRLEYRFDSEYDDKTRQFLGGLVLGSKVKEPAGLLFQRYCQSDPPSP